MQIFRRFSRFAVFLPILTFLLITLGGVVRTSGAGLACPDWPLCHGQLLPLLQPLVLIEWTHRLVAGALGLLILGQALWTWLDPALRRQVGVLAGLALVLYLSQAVLGGLTVLNLLAPGIVNLHLANGLALFAILIVIALRVVRLTTSPLTLTLSPGERELSPQASVLSPRSSVLSPPYSVLSPQSSQGPYRLALATALVVYLQAILGGGVSSNGAGLACPDFPTCHGLWLPPLVGMVGLQVAHRIGALVTLLLVMWLHAATIRGPLQARRAARLAASLVIIQIALGIGNVYARLTIPLSAAHLATAAALLAMAIVTSYATRPGSQAKDAASPCWQEAHAA